MKTQIIYLDPHDDHVSARDKLGWAKAPRAVLVWPNRGRVLTRRLDLVLLQRYAQEHNLQIGLVTYDPEVRHHADLLGVPVFDSLDEIPDDGWHRRSRRHSRRPAPQLDAREVGRPQPPPKSLPQPKNRALRIALSSAAILTLAALLGTLLPSARIILEPITTHETHTIEMTLDPEMQQIDPGGSIPARWVHVQIGDTLRKSTSGHVSIPQTKAQGEALLTNLTDEPFTLGTGTVLRATSAGGVQFETLEAVDLPGEEGAQASVSIRAVKPGAAGNVPADTIDALLGPLGLKIAVGNPEQTTGGSEARNPAVAKSDVDALEQDLEQAIMESAAAKLKEQLDPGEMLHEASIRIQEILTQRGDRSIGEPAETVALTMEAEVQALAYAASDVLVLADTLLDKELPRSLQVVPGSTQIQSRSHFIEETTQTAGLRVVVRREVYQQIDWGVLKRSVRAQTPEDAAAWLQRTYELERPPRILLQPAWLPRLPWLTLRIDAAYTWDAP